jgi:hypothetical protein
MLKEKIYKTFAESEIDALEASLLARFKSIRWALTLIGDLIQLEGSYEIDCHFESRPNRKSGSSPGFTSIGFRNSCRPDK